jgi:hypothetical protein
MSFDYDRFLVDQLIRPVANLYRVTPLAVGDTPAGGPVAFVRQKKLAVKEDIRFYADENETTELFRLKARSMLDIGGSRYDVLAGDERIGFLRHKFRESLLRSTWHIGGPHEDEIGIARERSLPGAIGRRVADFVSDGRVVGGLDRKFKVRDQYVLDLSGDSEKTIDRRVAVALAVGLDALQNR